jgi:hypothetical protein
VLISTPYSLRDFNTTLGTCHPFAHARGGCPRLRLVLRGTGTREEALARRKSPNARPPGGCAREPLEKSRGESREMMPTGRPQTDTLRRVTTHRNTNTAPARLRLAKRPIRACFEGARNFPRKTRKSAGDARRKAGSPAREPPSEATERERRSRARGASRSGAEGA